MGEFKSADFRERQSWELMFLYCDGFCLTCTQKVYHVVHVVAKKIILINDVFQCPDNGENFLRVVVYKNAIGRWLQRSKRKSWIEAEENDATLLLLHFFTEPDDKVIRFIIVNEYHQ